LLRFVKSSQGGRAFCDGGPVLGDKMIVGNKRCLRASRLLRHG
jgi:hypothetical protein